MASELTSTSNLAPKPQAVTARLALSIASALCGMFIFGWNVSVMNNPAAVIQQFINETHMGRTNGSPMPQNTLTILWAFTNAIFAFGGMIGGLISGWWADRLGRKPGMMTNTLFGIAGGLLMALSKPARSYELIIIGRFVIGFCCGLYTSICPMYNSEVSYPRIRGGVGVLNQLAATIGILLSQVLGLGEVLGNERLWPVVLGLTAIPPFLQLITMPFNPESPRYLFLVKKDEEATLAALRKLRGTEDVSEEIEEMNHEKIALAAEEKMSIVKLFKSSSLRLAMAVSIAVHCSQQLTGIIGIFYYSRSLFEGAGLATRVASYATLGVGSIMVTMTLVTVPLMDRVGRRTLHLAGLVGMCFFMIIFTIAFHHKDRAQWLNAFSVVMALLIVTSFGLGPGSVPWMITAELFSQGARPAAISISILVNWASHFIVGQIFPILQSALRSLVFIPFIILLFLFILFLFKFLPETKNKTIEEITAMFTKDKSLGNKVDPAEDPEMKGTEGVYKSFKEDQPPLKDSAM